MLTKPEKPPSLVPQSVAQKASPKMNFSKLLIHACLALVCSMNMLSSLLHSIAHSTHSHGPVALGLSPDHHHHHAHDEPHHHHDGPHHDHQSDSENELSTSWLATVVHPFLHHHHEQCHEESEYLASSSFRLHLHIPLDADLASWPVRAPPLLRRLVLEESFTGSDPPRRQAVLDLIATEQLLI